ncbi:MAG: hypothetical protein KA914_10320 [Ottowia sp.]|nr:hypothetical protein [Ottowia sp.]
MSISTQTPPRALALSRKNWLQAAMFLMVLCALWLASGVAMAQEAKLSDADETALRTYVLRPEIVDRSLQLAQDARRQQIKGSAGKGTKTLDGFASGLSSDPKAKALLDKHQLSARDYVMTMIALMRAGFASEANPKTPEEAGTNAANIAYVKANKERIATAMRGGSDKAEPKASAASKPAQPASK